MLHTVKSRFFIYKTSWPLSTGNSNTLSSCSIFLSWHHSFVLQWYGTLPFWEGMLKISSFSCISLLELGADVNIIPNYALAIGCRVADNMFHQNSLIQKVLILLKMFFESVNRKGNRVGLHSFKIDSFISTGIGIAADCKKRKKKKCYVVLPCKEISLPIVLHWFPDPVTRKVKTFMFTGNWVANTCFFVRWISLDSSHKYQFNTSWKGLFACFHYHVCPYIVFLLTDMISLCPILDYVTDH